jgi:type I restriction enzyme S subunit
MSWAVKKLSDISTAQYGYTESASETPVGPKFLRITDIVPPQIDWEAVPFCPISESDFKKYKLSAGDIVVARTGATTGYAKLIRNCPEAVFASYLIRFTVTDSDVLPEYLGRLMESELYKAFVERIQGGAAQPNANAKTLSLFKFSLPDTETQAKISKILGDFDSLIETNRRRIQLLEEAARLIYREWFVHLRFPGHEKVKVVKGVPEGWEMKLVPDVCETVGGGTPATDRSEFWEDGDIPWYSPTDLTNSTSLMLFGSDKMITKRGLDSSSAKMLPNNAILMTSRASLGYFGLVDSPCSTNQGFISMVPKKDNLRLYLLFNFMSRVREIESWATGSTFLEISKGNFRRFRVVVPPKPLLELFEKTVGAILSQSRTIGMTNILLNRAREILLPRLMNGTIKL